MKKNIRVICPSGSMHYVGFAERERAEKRFLQHNYNITYGRHIDDLDFNDRASIDKRIDDLHAGLNDPNIDYLLAGVGGFHSIEILDYIDFELLRKKSKPIIGFSDITVLQNAILTKTGNLSYSGPNFSLFSMEKGFEYIEQNFFNNLEKSNFQYTPSLSWSDDEWYIDQENRIFIDNKSSLVIVGGKATGRLVGGNLSSMALLQGTGYMPSLKNSILMIEEDSVAGNDTLNIMIRQLNGLLHSGGKPNAILIGRYQKASHVENIELKEIISDNFAYLNIPIIANLDFGHTTPCFTFPIGASADIRADIDKNDYEIKIMKRK